MAIADRTTENILSSDFLYSLQVLFYVFVSSFLLHQRLILVSMALSLAAHTHNLVLLSTTKTIAIGHGRTKSRRADSMVVKMAVTYEEGQLKRPKWGGETPLSRLVGALISFKPLSALLKLGARQVLIRFPALSLHILSFQLYCNLKDIYNFST